MVDKTKMSKAKSQIVNSLHEAIKSEDSFVIFKLNLSTEERQMLHNLKADKENSYNNFGAIDLIKPEASRFLQYIGNNQETSDATAKVIHRLVSEALSAFNADAGWVSIRAFVPSDDYDTPRWHKDGWFFNTPEGYQRKVAIVLKGASTLFNNMPKSQQVAFDELCNALSSDQLKVENRRKIAELVDSGLTQTAKEDEGSIFVVGSNRAAIHSEPPIHSERIFLSIVPGTKEQIEELRSNWKRSITSYSKE